MTEFQKLIKLGLIEKTSLDDAIAFVGCDATVVEKRVVPSKPMAEHLKCTDPLAENNRFLSAGC